MSTAATLVKNIPYSLDQDQTPLSISRRTLGHTKRKQSPISNTNRQT